MEPVQRQRARHLRHADRRLPANAREDGEARRRHAEELLDADILDIAAAHRTEPQYTDAVAFYVVFLPGYFIDDSGTEQKTTLGVSIGDTGVIGMFKPAISTPVVNPTPPPQFVEQLALIHFLGHAVGFVDNGVPVGDNNKAHIDTANGHHCTNKQCAMSFANESATGAVAYAKTLIRSPEVVLIGQECLSDARLLESKLRSAVARAAWPRPGRSAQRKSEMTAE